jgi:hypothetical protein
MGFERLPDAGCQGGRHQSTDGHHHEQGHEALRLCALPRSSRRTWYSTNVRRGGSAVARSAYGCSTEGRHARGLTMQLSQGQVASPSCRGGASGSRRAALKRGTCTVVSKRHHTPGLCGCQPYFSLSPLTRRTLCGRRAAPHRMLEEIRRRVCSCGALTSPAHSLH